MSLRRYTQVPIPTPAVNLSAVNLRGPWSGPGVKDEWCEWETTVYRKLIAADGV